MRHAALLLALGLAPGCTTTYHFVSDIGGDFTLSLAPVSGDGVSIDLALPGMDREEYDALAADLSRIPDCASPSLSWSLDSLTEEPLFATLSACTADATVVGGDGQSATVTLELNGDNGQLYLDVESHANETPIPRVSVLEYVQLEEPLSAQGSWTGEIPVHGDWVEGDVPHVLTLQWNFPEHVESDTKVRDSAGEGIGDV